MPLFLQYLESELSDCLELGFDNANVALNLSCLLYADDTIILAETPEELQKALDAVDSYCQTWHLTVNASKTKVVIFSRGKVRRIPEFVYGGDPLEVVDDFVYLGVKFNYNGSFKKAISKQVTQARKALYSMLVKAKKLQLSVDTQCHLFDHLVLPVLLYGCEVWGYECIDQIEVFHRKFLRKVLNVNKCTPDCMVYGETGRGVILNHIKCRMIGFWLRLVKGKETKHSCVLLKFLLHLRADIHSPSKSQWLSFIANLFDTAGLGNVWLAQGGGFSAAWISHTAKVRLFDIFTQEWRAATWSNRICTNYRMFKDDLMFEKYLQILCKKDCITLSKFRCRTNGLPVNKGRFDASLTDELHCTLCSSADIGDEFHYIFVCPFFHKERLLYIPSSLTACKPSALHMAKLFKSADACHLKKLAKFVRIIMSQFSSKPKNKDSSFVENKVDVNVCTRSGRVVKNPVRLGL